MIPLRDDHPTHGTPIVTLLLIGACVLVFLWQLSLGERARYLVYALGAVPAVLLRDLSPPLTLVPAELTVFTSMFLHGGWMHLVGNMLYLWIFGNSVEEAMGHGRFILFYVLCGTVAVIAQALPAPDSTVPMIGASGAISGVLGAYFLLYPQARVMVAVPIGIVFHTLELPAVLVLGLWFVLQLVSGAVTQAGQPGVAFSAHVGGFVAGLVLVPLFRRRGVPLWQGRGDRAPPRPRW